ncbi:MAG: HEPN domain-containing protein [Thermoplasmatales archaeon]|nr:HEPN domain-containing protein [Thermoplasmatales archaeon]
MSDYKDCFKRGLLRKIEPSEKKGLSSLEKAEEWIVEAEKNKDVSANDSCISSSYMAMFHSARAILFRDGVREKSHFCIARYLEKYVEENCLEDEWIFLLDRIRDVRHTDQYSLHHHATEEEALSALNSAKDFTNRMKKLFSETSKL